MFLRRFERLWVGPIHWPCKLTSSCRCLAMWHGTPHNKRIDGHSQSKQCSFALLAEIPTNVGKWSGEAEANTLRTFLFCKIIPAHTDTQARAMRTKRGRQLRPMCPGLAHSLVPGFCWQRKWRESCRTLFLENASKVVRYRT